MSHNTSSTCRSPRSTGFLSIFTPTVVWYLSVKMLWTKRDTRLVLPTANPPIRHTFCWIIGQTGRVIITRRHERYNIDPRRLEQDSPALHGSDVGGSHGAHGLPRWVSGRTFKRRRSRPPPRPFPGVVP